MNNAISNLPSIKFGDISQVTENAVELLQQRVRELSASNAELSARNSFLLNSVDWSVQTMIGIAKVMQLPAEKTMGELLQWVQSKQK